MTTIMAIVIIANIQQMIRNMNVKKGPFEGFFVSSVEFCKHVNFDDNKKIIKQERKVLKVLKVHKVFKVHLAQPEVSQVPKAHQVHKA